MGVPPLGVNFDPSHLPRWAWHEDKDEALTKQTTTCDMCQQGRGDESVEEELPHPHRKFVWAVLMVWP